jgi:hypothetical protein
VRFTTSRTTSVLLCTCVLLAATLAACSGASSSGASSSASSPAASTDASASGSAGASTAASPSSTVTFPDPCTLLTPEHIKQVLKADPGTSVSSEKECRYSSGLLLGITAASDWQTAKDSITADASLKAESLPGLGTDALTVASGTKRLVIATEGDYVVAVQGALSQQQGVDLAGGMLSSLAALASK